MFKVWKLVHIAKNIIVLNGNERGNKMKYFKGQIELKGEYRLVDENDYFDIYDKNNNRIYRENLKGVWFKREYDKNNNEIYFEDSDRYIVDNRPEKEVTMTIKEIEKKLNIVGLKIVKEWYKWNIKGIV